MNYLGQILSALLNWSKIKLLPSKFGHLASRGGSREVNDDYPKCNTQRPLGEFTVCGTESCVLENNCDLRSFVCFHKGEEKDVIREETKERKGDSHRIRKPRSR